MVDIAVLFGANKEQAKEQLHQSLEFEMALANVCYDFLTRNQNRFILISLSSSSSLDFVAQWEASQLVGAIQSPHASATAGRLPLCAVGGLYECPLAHWPPHWGWRNGQSICAIVFRGARQAVGKDTESCDCELHDVAHSRLLYRISYRGFPQAPVAVRNGAVWSPGAGGPLEGMRRHRIWQVGISPTIADRVSVLRSECYGLVNFFLTFLNNNSCSSFLFPSSSDWFLCDFAVTLTRAKKMIGISRDQILNFYLISRA